MNIYAIYTGLVYLTPLIGGRLADRYLGQRKAVFIGGILMALGQFALTQREFLYLGLGLIIIGNGFFKPNISTMVGELYPQGDPRRDGAYTIFYMGINLGAFIAPLVCGPLGERVGWGYGFAAAGVGMILGVVTFVFTQRFLMGAGLPPGRAGRGRRQAPAPRLGRDRRDRGGDRRARLRAPPGLAFPAAPLVARLAHQLDRRVPVQEPDPRRRPGPLPLRDRAGEGRRRRDRTPRAVHASRLGAGRGDHHHQPVLDRLLGGLRAVGRDDEPVRRREYGPDHLRLRHPRLDLPGDQSGVHHLDGPRLRRPLDLPGAAAVPAPVGHQVRHGADPAQRGVRGDVFRQRECQVGQDLALWLISVYFIFTVAELCLSPIGLSLVNKLAHPKIASLMMAFWFLCTAAANYLAGIMEQTIEPYHLNLWAFLGVLALVPGLLLLAMGPVLVKMSHGRV